MEVETEVEKEIGQAGRDERPVATAS